jgi:DNA modification methylase
MIELNTIYNEDCLETMKRMLDGFVDLTVTSPPYDNLREYKGYSFDFESIAKELYRVTKPGGVLVWVIGDSTIAGSESGTSFRQALYFKDLGFKLHDTMIYAKNNPIPLTHNRYEQAFEYMFVLVKGKLSTFNPLKEKTITSGAYNQYRPTGRFAESATRNRDEITVTKEEKYLKNIWSYSIGTKETLEKHPAPFPLKLARDHIVSWSIEGELIYDPFIGSGTTAKACKDLGRNYIGSEISAEYCKIAESRLAQGVFDFEGLGMKGK